MIWGRKKSDTQAYIWFAWYPVELEDGRWAWFHHVRAMPEPFVLHWRDWTYHAIDGDK